MVDVGGSSAQRGLVDGGVPHQVVLQVHDWFGTPDEQQAVVVVQLADFVRGQQFFATMSSDEFKKDKHYPKKNFFYGICLFCFR